METTIEIILDNLQSVELSKLEYEKSIVRFNLNASICHSNSAYFLGHAEDSPNIDMERIDRLVSLRFKDQADMDERFAAATIRRLERIVDLKQLLLSLLERFEKLNEP